MFYRKKELAIVAEQTQLADGIFSCRIRTEAAAYAVPGQFISIYPKDKSTLLPRPISICEADAAKGELRIVYRVAGKGTAEFSGYGAGDTISILCNLGNGYSLEEAEGKRVFIMGGGIGIPPMLELSKRLNANKRIILGYRNNQTFLKEEFEKYGEVFVATEDGSVGTKGTVLDAIADNNLQADVIMACGPMPMLRAIKTYASQHNIKAYISLEERMACGVGACLGCVCKTKKEDWHSHVNNTRVCTEGPVFDAEEVDI